MATITKITTTSIGIRPPRISSPPAKKPLSHNVRQTEHDQQDNDQNNDQNAELPAYLCLPSVLRPATN